MSNCPFGFTGGGRGNREMQKARRCRAQELARSSAQKNERQKKAGLLNREGRYGIGRAMWAGKAEQKKPAAS